MDVDSVPFCHILRPRKESYSVMKNKLLVLEREGTTAFKKVGFVEIILYFNIILRDVCITKYYY